MTMNETIEPKDGLRLRKIGSRYMIVEACNGNVNMTDVFSLNETAARLWQRINEGKFTPEELAGWLCDVRYGQGYGPDGRAKTTGRMEGFRADKIIGIRFPVSA